EERRRKEEGRKKGNGDGNYREKGIDADPGIVSGIGFRITRDPVIAEGGISGIHVRFPDFRLRIRRGNHFPFLHAGSSSLARVLSQCMSRPLRQTFVPPDLGGCPAGKGGDLRWRPGEWCRWRDKRSQFPIRKRCCTRRRESPNGIMCCTLPDWPLFCWPTPGDGC